MALAAIAGSWQPVQAQKVDEEGPAYVSPALMTGLAALNTVAPVAIGTVLLWNEDAEGLGVALLVWGWVVGPAPFNLYFGDTRGALIGLGIRGAAILASAAITSGGTWDEDGSSGTEIALLGLFAISGASAVFNLIDLPGAVRGWNERRMSVGLVPVRAGAAVTLSYRF